MKTLLLALIILLALTVSTSIAAQHSKIHGFDKWTSITNVMLNMHGQYQIKTVNSYDRYPKKINKRTYCKVIYYQTNKIIVFRFNRDGYLISGATYSK